MPYASNADLPAAVKKLPAEAQTKFREVFNSAWHTYHGDEEKAFRTAWSSVKKSYERVSTRTQDFWRKRDV